MKGVYRPPSSLVKTCGASEYQGSVSAGPRPTLYALRTHVNLSLELFGRLDRSGNDDDLSTLDLLSLDTTQEGSHVVTGLASIELLVEHFNPGQGGLERATHTEDLDFGTLGDGPTLDLAGSDGSSSRDRKDVLDVHQEGLVEVTCGVQRGQH